MNYQTLINKSIKELRLRNNLTQEEFAEKIGLSMVGVSNIERNRYHPSATIIDNICRIYDISPAELLIERADTNDSIIKNIVVLLQNCTPQKLKKYIK